MAKNAISLKKTRPGLAATRPGLVITLPSLKDFTRQLARTAMVRRVARFCSELTEEDISATQIVYYLYAQLAALTLCLPIEMETGWRACALLLCVMALREARRPADGE